MDVVLKDVGHLYGHLKVPAYKSRTYQTSYVFPLQSIGTKYSGLELVQQLVLVVRRRERDIGVFISYIGIADIFVVSVKCCLLRARRLLDGYESNVFIINTTREYYAFHHSTHYQVCTRT